MCCKLKKYAENGQNPTFGNDVRKKWVNGAQKLAPLNFRLNMSKRVQNRQKINCGSKSELEMFS